MINNSEDWRAVPGYEGYYWINSSGQVKNVQGRILSQIDCGNGLHKIKLQARGQKDDLYISTLLAEVFPETQGGNYGRQG